MPARTKQPRNKFSYTSVWGDEVEVTFSRVRGRGDFSSTMLRWDWEDKKWGRGRWQTMHLYNGQVAHAYVVGVEERRYTARGVPPVPDGLQLAREAIAREASSQPYFITVGGDYGEVFHLRMDYPTAYELFETSSRLQLISASRTGTWTAIVPTSQLQPFASQEDAEKLAKAANEYHLFHSTGGARSSREDKERRRLGGEEVLLGTVQGVHFFVADGANQREPAELSFYSFPRSGTDDLEVRVNRRVGSQVMGTQSFFVSGSEMAARWERGYRTQEFDGENVLVAKERGALVWSGVWPRKPGYWANANDVFGVLMASRSAGAQYAPEGRGFPIEVEVVRDDSLFPGQNALKTSTYLAEYDGRDKAGQPRIKLTHLRPNHNTRQFWSPLRRERVLYARGSDGFTQLYSHPTKNDSVSPRLTDEGRGALSVLVDVRYEQGLHGIHVERRYGRTPVIVIDTDMLVKGAGRDASEPTTIKLWPSAWSAKEGTIFTLTFTRRNATPVTTSVNLGWVQYLSRERNAEYTVAMWTPPHVTYRFGLDDEDAERLRVYLDGMLEQGEVEAAAGTLSGPSAHQQVIEFNAPLRSLSQPWANRMLHVTLWEVPVKKTVRLILSDMVPEYLTEDELAAWSQRNYDWVRFTHEFASAAELREHLRPDGLHHPMFDIHTLILLSPEQLSQLNVWLDSLLEGGTFQGLGADTTVIIPRTVIDDATGQEVAAPLRYRFKMVRDLGCGLYIGQPSKKSKLTGPYQLLLKDIGVRVVSGTDVDVLEDLAVMFTSHPGVCERLEQMRKMPYNSEEDSYAVHKAWRDVWYGLPLETRNAFTDHLKLLEREKLAFRKGPDED